MKRLVRFLLRYSKPLIFSAIGAYILTGLANTAILALINEGIQAAGSASSLMIGAFIALCVLLPSLRILGQNLIAKLSQKAIFELRTRLCRQILQAPLVNTEKIGPSRLLAALTNDVNAVSSALVVLPVAFMHLSIITACFGYLIYLNLYAAGALMVSTLVATVLYMIVFNIANRKMAVARQSQDNVYQCFEGVTRGTKELKLHSERQEAFMKDHIGTHAATVRDYTVSALTTHTTAASISHMLFFAAIGVNVFLLPLLDPGITPEILVGYALVLLYLILPLENLTNIGAPIGNAMVSLRRLEELGMNITQENEGGNSVEATAAWSSISFDEITHRYYREKENQTFTLGPVSLEIKRGELIFLIGGNGSGKTTLAKMLVGLYIPESGTITLDGNRIEDENRRDFRQLFSVVFSDFYLFDHLLGLNEAGVDKKAKSYLEKLQLSHKVNTELGKLSTLDLSQGQRKRLALLTTFLEDRPIYLFDEWAADQDPYFKDIFYNQILPELKNKGKTVIVISHDDHYYQVADRVIKLDYGQVEYDLPYSEIKTETLVGTPATAARAQMAANNPP